MPRLAAMGSPYTTVPAERRGWGARHRRCRNHARRSPPAALPALLDVSGDWETPSEHVLDLPVLSCHQAHIPTSCHAFL